jgi:hypothetical protein
MIRIRLYGRENIDSLKAKESRRRRIMLMLKGNLS